MFQIVRDRTSGMEMQRRWPDRLFVVRHGESAGNVALARARAAGLARLDLDLRDADVPLSKLGRQQAQALGSWFMMLPSAERPQIVLASPYVRARQSAELIVEAAGLAIHPGEFVLDERLREKEHGVLDLLTEAGVLEHQPEQAKIRATLGKFYHRPPGGESWCDVILRLRSLLDTICLHFEGGRVLLVTHQVVVLCLRYLLEQLDEERVLAIDRQGQVANCSVTEYAYEPGSGRFGGMSLRRYNFVAPVLERGAPVTAAKDAAVGVR